jgi:NAD(P)-dependent dehydrogenase (short-subunit alcohol dehydrogenase family)
MPVPKYTYSGPIDHTLPIDREKVKGKSVIVTGGANGMGETCVRAFVASGAFVTFADVNERGYEVEKELNSVHGNCCKFVKCDIRSWDQQKTMFETARKLSPAKSVDVVLANAGISRSSGDSMWVLDGEYCLVVYWAWKQFIQDLC